MSKRMSTPCHMFQYKISTRQIHSHALSNNTLTSSDGATDEDGRELG